MENIFYDNLIVVQRGMKDRKHSPEIIEKIRLASKMMWEKRSQDKTLMEEHRVKLCNGAQIRKQKKKEVVLV